MALDNGLGLVPTLGWSSWNRYYTGVTEEVIRTQAAAFVALNLSTAGYKSIHIDAGWLLPTRDHAGNLQVDPAKFPSGITALSDYVHSLGLQLGGYTDLAKGSCGTGPGSLGFYEQDALWFANVAKLDYLKVVDFAAPVCVPPLLKQY